MPGRLLLWSRVGGLTRAKELAEAGTRFRGGRGDGSDWGRVRTDYHEVMARLDCGLWCCLQPYPVASGTPTMKGSSSANDPGRILIKKTGGKALSDRG